jgi:hypothetical protein
MNSCIYRCKGRDCVNIRCASYIAETPDDDEDDYDYEGED